ncbi:group-specific protein [Falsibacillus albus]|uniref:Group-specific protein n=1 Tax=Falsibacillus albus TaxID=2478915 RepID=A0A3L7JNX9_9BACI|nr:group-specific protein [Falsibacillus albus]RLQ92406.1 group-specific protein [Falsibacillus albus]
MKFYVASSFSNIANVRCVSQMLIDNGWIHTYDWTKNERAVTVNDLKQIGEKEKEAISESDLVIVMLPAGKGSHIELGIALGLNKRIILHSPTNEVNDFENTTTFYHLTEVEKFYGTVDELVEFVVGTEQKILN